MARMTVAAAWSKSTLSGWTPFAIAQTMACCNQNTERATLFDGWHELWTAPASMRSETVLTRGVCILTKQHVCSRAKACDGLTSKARGQRVRRVTYTACAPMAPSRLVRVIDSVKRTPMREQACDCAHAMRGLASTAYASAPQRRCAGAQGWDVATHGCQTEDALQIPPKPATEPAQT